jgi:hypothetical protein
MILDKNSSQHKRRKQHQKYLILSKYKNAVIAFQNSRAIFDLDNFVGDAGT